MPLSSEQAVIVGVRKMTDARTTAKSGPTLRRQEATPRSFLRSLLWSLSALPA
jgi:hypothetical protein